MNSFLFPPFVVFLETRWEPHSSGFVLPDKGPRPRNAINEELAFIALGKSIDLRLCLLRPDSQIVWQELNYFLEGR